MHVAQENEPGLAQRIYDLVRAVHGESFCAESVGEHLHGEEAQIPAGVGVGGADDTQFALLPVDVHGHLRKVARSEAGRL